MSLDRTVARSLREQWGLFLVEGVVLLVLGAAAILLPPIALALALFLGWLLLVTGLVGLVMTLFMRRAPGFWASLVSALAAIVAGFLLIGWPLDVAPSLSLVLAIFFAVEGIATIIFALEHKRAMSGRWSSMLASGIVDLVLSGIILTDFPGIAPGSAGWVIGLLVGISMVFGGASLIAMALDARAIKP
jgi:uncharacterized membrane protein HdeD (DUF308 family)